MTGMAGKRYRLLMASVAVCATVSVACAQQGEGQQKRPSTVSASPLEVISKGLKLRADPVEPKDFVRQSRPGEDRMNYIPTGSARPQPPSKPLSADQVKAKEAELQAVLARHDHVSGRKPAGRATTGATKPRPAVVAR